MANVTVNNQNYTGVNEVRLPITNGGGSEQSFVLPPSGTKSITANGNGIDVVSYAAVNVNVPTGITPTGTRNITANGTYDVTQYASANVNVSGGTTYDYVKQRKEVTDAFGLFTMKTDAKPEHVEIHITTNYSGSPAGWYVDFSFDFPTGTDFLQLVAQDDYGYNYGIKASRSQYGFAVEVFYTETPGSTDYVQWMSNTVSNRAIVDATVYSNQPVYEAFEPASGFWRADGKRILDGDGNVVVINGIGMAANDFLAETNKDAPSTWQISDATIAEVASLGFNAIRLYFGYQLLEDDSNPGVYKQSGWEWFDEILDWAEAHGVKVIFNMHCPPPAVQYSPSEESYNFWLEDQYGYQQRTIDLWAAIANRYKNNTTVIGYGPINELHLKLYNYSLAYTQCVMSDLFQRIINEIRSVDTNHMIFNERALWWYADEDYEEAFPGWSSTRINVNESFVYYPCIADSQLVCEHHDYQGRPTRDSSTGEVTPGESKSWMITAMQKTNDLFERLYENDAPIYIGEYGCDWGYDSSDEDFLRWTQDMHDICVEKGIAHNLHTYYGWHKGSGTYNSMGLRYVTSWHGSAMSGTLYEALADIYRPHEISLQSKPATPTESAQTITYDSGYDGLSQVQISAIPSNYVGSGIARKSSSDLTASGATVNVPSGYYSAAASKSVASGTAGTPTATKSAVQNNSITVTPSVTNATGYITGGTKTGTPVTVSASEVATLEGYAYENASYDITNYRTLIVQVPQPSLQDNRPVTAPASGTTTVTAEDGYDAMRSVIVSPTPTETKSITENGTYTPTSGKHFSQVTVNVPGSQPSQRGVAVIFGDSVFDNTVGGTNFGDYLEAQGIYAEVRDFAKYGSGFVHSYGNDPDSPNWNLYDMLCTSSNPHYAAARQAVEDADVIYLDLGGNDGAYFANEREYDLQFLSKCEAVFDAIHEINESVIIKYLEPVAPVSQIVASPWITNPYNGGVEGASYYAWSRMIINYCIATTDCNIKIADVGLQNCMRKLASDNFHPALTAAVNIYEALTYGGYADKGKFVDSIIVYRDTNAGIGSSIVDSFKQMLAAGLFDKSTSLLVVDTNNTYATFDKISCCNPIWIDKDQIIWQSDSQKIRLNSSGFSFVT